MSSSLSLFQLQILSRELSPEAHWDYLSNPEASGHIDFGFDHLLVERPIYIDFKSTFPGRELHSFS
jgi:hypothetical protein